MKIENIRLLKEPEKSFIVFKENKEFSPWHHHPEFELVYITKGQGKRMIGDHIARFDDGDLILLGTYLPHEWLCDKTFYSETEGFRGEGIVIQFLYDFLGKIFFEIPENSALNKLLQDASRGIKFSNNTKKLLIPLVKNIVELSNSERLYSLFSIFKILSESKDYTLLCSPGFMEPFHANENTPMQKAMQYILQNFQKNANIDGILSYTKMSNTAFCMAFKKNYRMTFKEYILKIRVGYACNLLIDNSLNISEVAYNSGFENISNFNRQFKKIKGITPSQFRDEYN